MDVDRVREAWHAWDDVSGSELDPTKVRRARLKELQYIREKRVWSRIPRREAERRGIKVIKTRWIDISKGDEINENYRSRLVAKEFNVSKEDGLFAATPPLEALKYLLSCAATLPWSQSAVLGARAQEEMGV